MTNETSINDSYPDFDEFLSDLNETYLNEDDLLENSKFMKGFNIISLNIRSLSANFTELCILIDKFGPNSPHVICLQETFKINSRSENLLQIPNYDFVYCSRERFQGGGVCCYVRHDV